MGFRTGLALIAMIAFATASSGQTPPPPGSYCASVGGHIETRGPAQIAVCVRPYADAGKPCRNKADCKGLCLAVGSEPQGARAIGRCQNDETPLFCPATVERGKVVRVLCID